MVDVSIGCLRVGMRIPIHSSRVELMIPVPCEVVRIPMNPPRVWMNIPYIV